MRLSEEDLLRFVEATRAVASTLRLSDLLALVMRLAGEVAHAEASSLLLVDLASGELYFDVARGEKGGALPQVRLRKGEGIAGWVAENRKPAVVNDVAEDPRWTRRIDQTTAFETKALLAVPMQVKDKLIGVMEVINRSGGARFDEADAQILGAFAAQAAIAIENARLFESIRQEKEKMATILAEMAEGAVLMDAAGRILLVNSAARRLLGRPSLEGRSWPEIEEAYEAAPAWQARQRATEGGSMELSRKAPPRLFLAGVFSRVCNDGGEVAGSLMVFRDVTEERREAQLKKNFISLISHKLRTPLVAIRGFAALLLEKPEALTTFQKGGIETIDRNSRQLAGLVDKLIGFSTLETETGMPDLTRTPQSPGEAVEAALEELEPFLKAQSADILRDPSLCALPLALMDKEWIKQVLRNLIENAVKFNARPPRRVRLGGRATDSHRVELFVADNGPGIPPEEQTKIFQKFYQIESDFTGQVQGLGLGLALVKRVVQAHGGEVRLDSSLGAGSTFTISLPAV